MPDIFPDFGATNYQALVWTGTADSCVYLGSLPPASFPTSQAMAIDASGKVYGWARNTTGTYYAIEWPATAVPEPSVLLLATLSAFALSRGKNRQ